MHAVTVTFADESVRTYFTQTTAYSLNTNRCLMAHFHNNDNIQYKSSNAYDDIMQWNKIILNMTGHRLLLIRHHASCANELADKSLTPEKQGGKPTVALRWCRTKAWS